MSSPVAPARGDQRRIGLLQCGHIHPEAAAVHGDYPDVFADLFADHPDLALRTYDVRDGSLPGSVNDCDGWLVSGAAESTYDDLPWVSGVEGFLRTIVAREVPLVAVCFGHQLLAQAFGGRVERAATGWVVGARDYAVAGRGEPFGPGVAALRLIASHQDQVVDLPDGAEVLASTDQCPIAAFRLGPRAVTIQPHPEFSAALSRDLLDLRRGLFGDVVADTALATLDAPLDRGLAATWMADALRA